MSERFRYACMPLMSPPTSPYDLTGDNNLGIYATEATQRFMYGTRYITWDGRVFKYAHAGAAITTEHVDYGLYFAGGHRSAWNVACTHSYVAGDTSMRETFAAADTTTVAEDELAGGFVVIYKAGIANQAVRQIVGNTAHVSSVVTMYLDRPLTYAVTVTTDHYEVLANPYADVRSAYATGTTMVSMAGMPTVAVALGSNTWIQTWGIARVSMTEPGVYERTCYMASNGSFVDRTAAIASGNDQACGHLILPGTEHSSFLMLQLSI